MEFRVLGLLQVVADDGSPVRVSQPLIRATLSVLVARAGRPLSRAELTELIWPQVPSPGAVRTCVYDVRRLVGGERLARDSCGYRLTLATTDRTDLGAFRDAAAAGERALARHRPRAAAELFAEALSAWREPSLRDLPDTAPAQELAAGLTAERRRVRDALIETKLALGCHHELIGLLEAKTAEEPLNERGWIELMLALYRSGRSAEAIRAYECVRDVLMTDTGTEPGPQLRRLRRQIEAGDPALLGPPAQTRRTDYEAAPPLPRLDRAGRATAADIDVSKPNIARMYDYFLGGKDNYAADREAAEKVIAAAPQAPALAHTNRAFMHRAVRHLAETGIRQFIDVGSGLPTQENTHEVARRVAPGSRVVYVDNDPIVLTHSRALLGMDDQTVVIEADMRRPADILEHPRLRGVVDWSKPVGVLLTSVLHLITDEEEPGEIVARFRDGMAPGSHIVISHVSAQDHVASARRGAAVYRQVGATTNTLRERDEILAFFDGFDLVAPGLVPLPDWRPEPAAAAAEARRGEKLPVWYLGGVGRKK
ncbi:MAG TPA: SAM-dependent methyltransferase [Streptosporangiaceae bacterium]|nr:SAM-dependent methyltransferase [Streptosporangiaceae bacterium]